MKGAGDDPQRAPQLNWGSRRRAAGVCRRPSLRSWSDRL